MNKAAIWLAGIAITAVVGISGTLITSWVQGVNSDHETLRELVFKDRYLHGSDPAAPIVTATKE